MQKIKICSLVLWLLVPFLLAGCFGEKPLQEQEAVNMADKAVTANFPQMTNASKKVAKYTSDNIEFYDVTYNQKMPAQSEGRTIEITQIVIVTINTKTKEQIISVSD